MSERGYWLFLGVLVASFAVFVGLVGQWQLGAGFVVLCAVVPGVPALVGRFASDDLADVSGSLTRPAAFAAAAFVGLAVGVYMAVLHPSMLMAVSFWVFAAVMVCFAAGSGLGVSFYLLPLRSAAPSAASRAAERRAVSTLWNVLTGSVGAWGASTILEKEGVWGGPAAAAVLVGCAAVAVLCAAVLVPRPLRCAQMA